VEGCVIKDASGSAAAVVLVLLKKIQVAALWLL